jgi:uncharacterized protein (TIGR00251 family)
MKKAEGRNPSMAAPEFQIERENVSFWLKVKPRATRERLGIDSSGELRLELHAPPAEGQANEACVQFFARALRLPQACVVILSGHKSRRKLIRITGRSAQETVVQLKKLAGARG